MAAWDQCVHPGLTPLHTVQHLPIWMGVDASTKHDSTAIVACSFDKKAQAVRLVAHRIFQPSPDEPIDFETTVEATLLDLKRRLRVRKVYYDPFQMVASAQRLTKAGLKLEEFPQTVPNLTAATQNLFDLIAARTLITYPDAQIRLAVSRALAVENTRGWRIAKNKVSHKIEVVVALALAAFGAVRGQSESNYDTSLAWVGDHPDDEPIYTNQYGRFARLRRPFVYYGL
jgi:hypothetical protein